MTDEQAQYFARKLWGERGMAFFDPESSEFRVGRLRTGEESVQPHDHFDAGWGYTWEEAFGDAGYETATYWFVQGLSRTWRRQT